MQILIDIDDNLYTKIFNNGVDNYNDVFGMVKAIRNSTSLPKGHGRLLDEKEILAIEEHDGGWYDLTDMPEYIAGVKAIIEADKAESEERSDKE